MRSYGGLWQAMGISLGLCTYFTLNLLTSERDPGAATSVLESVGTDCF